MSASWGSGGWNCAAGFAQRLNRTLTISLNVSHSFWRVLTQNDTDLVAASLLLEKNMSRILGAFSLAVDVDNVQVLLPGAVNRVKFSTSSPCALVGFLSRKNEGDLFCLHEWWVGL